MPLSGLNSIRGFSASGHACGKLSKNIGVLNETPEMITTTNSTLYFEIEEEPSFPLLSSPT